MQLRVGYELIYDFPRPTPVILMLRIHPSRVPDLIGADDLVISPPVPVTTYQDAFGNRCSRLVTPQGEMRLSADVLINDSGQPDTVVSSAGQHPVEDLPEDVLTFLLGSRYCETDLLSDVAWNLFGNSPEGWGRVKAVCDFVHEHVAFGYEHARATKTAWDTFNERDGVCRDYTHLAVALCRCMNIPARYCTGYLTDIGEEPPFAENDFAAWFEAYLDHQWRIFDARFNQPRIGRVLIARGRDAADVPISNTFGPNTLKGFRVWAEEAV